MSRGEHIRHALDSWGIPTGLAGRARVELEELVEENARLKREVEQALLMVDELRKSLAILAAAMPPGVVT